MSKHKKQRKVKTIRKVSAQQFVNHAKQQVTIADAINFTRYMQLTDEQKQEKKQKYLYMMLLVYQLAQVQNDYLEIAIKELGDIGEEFTQERKRQYRVYFDLVETLKAKTAHLAWIVNGIGGKCSTSFYRDADYLGELIPLFLDRIGDDTRTDYISQCILQKIHEGYTSKLGFFEKYGLKHLTRTKEEAERIRQINRWKRNQKAIKEAVIKGQTPPAELPFPFPELDKQNYFDFE